MKRSEVVFVLALLLAAGSAPAQEVAVEPETPTKAVPMVAPAQASAVRLLRYSAALNDALGAPRTGVVGMTFALYAEPEGGAPLWLETQNVALDEQGRYTVLLGATQSDGLPLELFSTEQARWLEVTLAGEPGILPAAGGARILLVSVPYALKAADAERLGGKPASAFVLTPKAAGPADSAAGAAGAESGEVPIDDPKVQVGGSGTTNMVAKFTASETLGDSQIFDDGTNIGIGTTSPISKLHVNGNIRLIGQTTHQVQVTGVASSGRLGQDVNGFFFASDTPGKELNFFTNAGAGIQKRLTINGNGLVGIGTPSPARTLDVSGTGRFSGNTVDQVLLVSQTGSGNALTGSTASGSNAALFGQSTDAAGSGAGVAGLSTGVGGFGVTAVANHASGTTTGLFAKVFSGSGTAALLENSSDGKILSGKNSGGEVFSVAGDGTVTAASFVGDVSGGPSTFEGSSSEPTAILTAVQNGTGRALHAQSLGADSTGVFASGGALGLFAEATAESGTAKGILGLGDLANSTSIGVEGQATQAGVQGIASGVSGSGVLGRASDGSTTGTGVSAQALATSGSTIGVLSIVLSADGTAGVFNNQAGGKILSGLNNGVEEFSVAGDGTVTATSFVGDGSLLTGVTASNADTLDSLDSAAFAQLAQANTFTDTVTATSLVANRVSPGTILSVQSSGTEFLKIDTLGQVFVNPSLIFMNADGPDGNAGFTFFDGGSPLNESLLWIDATDRFEFTNDLQLNGILTAGTGSAAAPAFSFSSDSNTGMYRSATDTLKLVTAGADRLTVDASGRVGVGAAASTEKLEVAGNIKLGTNRDLFACSGVENLRILRGKVNGTNGACELGSGFTCQRSGVGSYQVFFSTAFPSNPVVVATASGGDNYANVDSFGPGTFGVSTLNAAGNLEDTAFNFIAIGPR